MKQQVKNELIKKKPPVTMKSQQSKAEDWQ